MAQASEYGSPRGDSDVRERIFSSALRHFSDKGFAATSLREVSQDAQTTKPMIYYYFKSKEGLYSSIVQEILEEMAGVIRDGLPADAPYEQRVMTYCQRYLDHFLENGACAGVAGGAAAARRVHEHPVPEAHLKRSAIPHALTPHVAHRIDRNDRRQVG